jgi:NhaP-type Na+/H+ or K+/H+ antiporter
MDHLVLKTLGIVFLLGMVSQWVAWRFRFPVIVLLTILGILFGPVFHIINPRSVFGPLLHPLIELAVAIILFEGGMSLKFHEFKQVEKGLIRLFSVAVIFNWLGGATIGHYVGGLNWGTALLISGILIVTGPTVIIPALREAKLKRSTSHYLKWEGIINDPIGAIIAVLVMQFLIYSQTHTLILSILKINAVAFGLSIFTRQVVLFASKRAMVPEYLKIPFFIGVILILFIASEFLQKGSGLLTTTLLGLFIGNLEVSSMKELHRFGESLATFTVASIFILLSASLDLKVWYELDWRHYSLIFMLAFVVRPVAIFLSTFKSGMSLKERILIGMYGPRGIVAASVAGVVGTGMYEYGFAEGRFVLPIIFSVILLTVVTHGFWLKPLARKLDLINKGEHGVLIVGASDWSIELAEKLRTLDLPVMVTDTSWYQLAQARHEGIQTHYGPIMYDLEYGEPELAEFNYLLALTEDDHYNSLVCHRLKHEFGADHVYQLPIHEDDFHKHHNLTRKDFCTLIDSTEPLYENMMQKSHADWNFRITTLSEKFDYESFRMENDPKKSIYFLIIRSNKRLEFFDRNKVQKPVPGDSLVYYAPSAN